MHPTMKHALHTPARLPLSGRKLPLVRKVDVAVAGGGVAAVAAALGAAQTGARVFLAAPRLYLGEDLAGTLRLWRDKPPDGHDRILQKLFREGCTTTPLRVKRALEDLLRQAGVDFVLGSLPVGLLIDGDEHVCGMILANRAGRQAVTAGQVIDASMHALLGRMVSQPPPASSPVRARHVVLGGLPGPAPLPVHSVPSGMERQGEPLWYHEYELKAGPADASPGAALDLEQQARDLTYREGRQRTGESLILPPPFSEITPVTDGLTVLPWTLSESAAGDAGTAAAKRANTVSNPSELRLRTQVATGMAQGDLYELHRGFRPSDEPADFVHGSGDSLPVLATVDVLVVGGGTSGAAAAIAAARAGARVLVIEYQEGLGGIGTVGLITKAYHGLDVGFAREVPFLTETQGVEYKMEWLRRELRQAGGRLWTGSLAYGAWRCGDRVTGAAIATPYGHGLVLAEGCVIDATGNADTAAAAGAALAFAADPEDIALQGVGLGARPLGRDALNSDFLLVDDGDVIDVTRAMVGSRAARDPDSAYDVVPIVQSRERQRIVGEHNLSYLDQLLGRTFPDSIVQSKSDYDAHGYPSLPFFALLPHDETTRVLNHPAPSGTPYTPYRALLPGGIEGLLVVGLGVGMHRDAGAMIRMQKDLLNQGYAAGLAAARAAREQTPLRSIDLKALQQQLVDLGALPATVLSDDDSFPLPAARVAAAVETFDDPARGYTERSLALAVMLTHSEVARPLLLAKHAEAATSEPSRLECAKVLGLLGESVAAPDLIAAVEKSTFDAKILQGKMAEYAHLPTPVDGLILALGYSGDNRALDALLPLLARLDAETTLSHHRAVALALEALGSPCATAPIAALLGKPGMRAHVMTGIVPLPEYPPEKRRREGALREILWARVLYRCGDCRGLGRTIVTEYRQDLRGLFARHAREVLAGCGASPTLATSGRCNRSGFSTDNPDDNPLHPTSS